MSKPTNQLDDLVRKFKGYCNNENDFDELDFKGAILDWADKEIIDITIPVEYEDPIGSAKVIKRVRMLQRLRLRGK
jgi:hypothetical protein